MDWGVADCSLAYYYRILLGLGFCIGGDSILIECLLRWEPIRDFIFALLTLLLFLTENELE